MAEVQGGTAQAVPVARLHRVPAQAVPVARLHKFPHLDEVRSQPAREGG